MCEQEENVFKFRRKDLRNKILSIKGKKYHVLDGKPSSNIKRSIFLLSSNDNENDDSSWKNFLDMLLIKIRST